MSICTFPVYEQKLASQLVNGFWKRLFNATIYMKIRVCFTCVKYECDMLSLCKTTNVFIGDLFATPKSIYIS